MSIAEHSLQSAHAAAKAGESEESVLACLLHDVGHLCGLEAGYAPGMEGCGTPEHERVGAELLKALGFPVSITRAVSQHVNAKRYLCGRDPTYMDKLSDASRTTLRFQGGPMSAMEVAAADADPHFPLALRMRQYDEAGKDPHARPLQLEDFEASISAVLRKTLRNDEAGHTYAHSYVLSSEQLRYWEEHGFLIVRGALSNEQVDALSEMTKKVVTDTKCKDILKHHEKVADGDVQICRVENFCLHHAWWGEFAFGLAKDLVSQAFGEEAVLFKDKINFKGPQGAGFLLHQDATAYATDELATRHISVLLAIDESTAQNGPLEVATALHTQGIFANEYGVITAEAEKSMAFTQVLVRPGDIVLFDSFLPHRSGSNLTQGWRRSAYLTYNVAAEGDLHEAYYARKKAAWAAGTAGSISINRDFAGQAVD
uniref:HD domain-containing protein n=1 Tax=Calcidiscus leptoporus TaxID=127549 RepID=A0A7S0IQ31_9EUKA